MIYRLGVLGMGRFSNTRPENETGVVRKNWKGRIRVVLVYPNHYAVGMSNLGFQAVYRLINAIDHVLCERAFLPDGSGDEAVRSVESGRFLHEFDIIAFSVSFENDFPNLLSILHQAGVPLRSADRMSPHPLVLGGGVACFLNPEPIAPFIDCFLMGEAEVILSEFFNLYTPTGDRNKLLREMARSIRGVYVPGFYKTAYNDDGTLKRFKPICDVPETIKRRYISDLAECPTTSMVLTPHTTFKETFLIEVARGCPHGCRFCSAGFVYRPPRFRPVDLLEQCVEKGLGLTHRIGLVSTAVSDLPGLETLCKKALESDMVLSFSSLRTDAMNAEFASVLRQSRVKTATLAPDAGSERMRRVINKGITEDDLLNAVEVLIDGGIPNLKLYFMVGLPTETMEDVEAIVRLCRRVKKQFLVSSRARKRIGTITVSLNAFVPKPVTPFQWAAMEDQRTLKKKIKWVKQGLRREANVSVKTDPLRRDVVQALLSRGDRNVANLLERRHETGATWPGILKTFSKASGFYITRERPVSEKLPWDFIDHGISNLFLAGEYRKAKEGRVSAPCPMKDCSLCGVCKSDTQ